MNRFLAGILMVLAMFFGGADVQGANIGSQEVLVTLSDSYVSRYIWRGQDLYADNDGAHQLSIDVAFPKFLYGTDLSFNLWGSFPLNSGHEDGEELDYAVAFARDLLDEQFNLSAGFTYFDYPNTSSTADVAEPWFSIVLNKIPFLPIDISATVFAGYDFAAKAGGPDEGWYYSWSFATDIVLADLPFTQKDQVLSLGFTNWGNDGVADLKPSKLYATDIFLSTSYQYKGFTFTPALNYTLGHNESINSGNDEFWTSFQVAYSF
ncbi:MAG: hypothetical protein KJ619_00875 [Candidatus Omnitrophica bacterium]|nr:hypothetical protein [Candidatus Omnitrophota bacterium]